MAKHLLAFTLAVLASFLTAFRLEAGTLVAQLWIVTPQYLEIASVTRFDRFFRLNKSSN